jgi:osmotically-inducible protein OsmY
MSMGLLHLNTSADLALKRRVETFLYRSGRHRLRQLQVQVDSGVVTLKGTVSTYYERQLAISFCQRVAGVVSIQDRLEVSAT